MFLNVLFMMFFSLVGCNSQELECTEEIPCGFGETCVAGQCVGSSCATSVQCEMEEYCDKGACVDGCASDKDCYPGDHCNPETQSCEQSACTSTQVDCDFKEYCNSITGDCVPASGFYCKECQTDSDCGGNGNSCLDFGVGRYCGVSCQVESDCPSGFTCLDSPNLDQPQCITYCWLYITDRPETPGDPGLPGVLDLPLECPLKEAK